MEVSSLYIDPSLPTPTLYEGALNRWVVLFCIHILVYNYCKDGLICSIGVLAANKDDIVYLLLLFIMKIRQWRDWRASDLARPRLGQDVTSIKVAHDNDNTHKKTTHTQNLHKNTTAKSHRNERKKQFIYSNTCLPQRILLAYPSYGPTTSIKIKLVCIQSIHASKQSIQWMEWMAMLHR